MKKALEFEPVRLKKSYADKIRLHNYHHSLKLKGFVISATPLSRHSPKERAEHRTALRKRYIKR
ncbi:YhfG family protein [Microbulbifer sp. ZKSA006]|uniref:YhfG family protein n=1 Tax=Microbulbifer sp. ZKSA006 TaxID=3243390 RepID=UPI0040394D32